MERKTSMHLIIVILTGLFLFETQANAHELHDIAAARSSYIEISAKIEEYQSDNFKRKKSERHYFATDIESKSKYEIHFDKKAPKHFKTGNVLMLKGLLIGSDLFLKSGEAENFAALSLSGGTSDSSTVAAAVSGVQNTLVISIDSNDGGSTCSKDQITDFMFNNVSNSINYMYQEASYNAVSFSGAVYDHVKINVNSAGACDYSGWGSAAEQALIASGVNTSGFNKKVYVLPSNNNCGWAGLGMLGGSGAWIHGGYCGSADVYAHELGHNLSLHHARTPSSEYGDYSDIMGSSGVGLRTINGAHKAFMGWTPSTKIANGGIGTFTIAPLELNPSSTSFPQLVKISKPDTAETYYFSYRRPLGYDVRVSSGYTDKLNVHTQSGGYSTFYAALDNGQTYSDAVNGLSVTVISRDDNSITFKIDGNCNVSASKMSLSPATQGGAAGQTLNYNVSIQNLDSPYCAASQYNLQAVLPAELQAVFSANNLNVAAGASATISVAVTSSAAVLSGNYGFQIAGKDSLNAIHDVNASANYIIDGEAPSAPSNLNFTLSKAKINLSWSASADNVAVTGYEIMRNDVVVATSQTTYYSALTKQRGTFIYKVRARDAAGNFSSWSNAVTFTK